MTRKRQKESALNPASMRIVTIALLAASFATAQEPSFRSDVFPILRDNCLACHSAQTKMGELVMESYEGLMEGGKKGPAIVPNNSGESRLVLMLEGEVEPRMPMGGELPPQNIAVIREWIDAGAKGEEVAGGPLEIPDIEQRAEVSSPVGSLAFSPDGEVLAVGRHQEVHLIDPSSGEIRATLKGHEDLVRSLAFSPGGELLAAAGGAPAQSGEVKLWNIKTKDVIGEFNAHSDCIYAVDFSADGRWLATASYDQRIELWDVDKGIRAKTFKDHVDAVYAVDFGPEAGVLASAAADRSIKIWDLEAGKPRLTLSESQAAVLTLTFDPTGRRIAAAGSDKTIRTWRLDEDRATLIKAMTGHEGAILQVVYSPDGKTLISSSADRALKVWDAETLREQRVLDHQSDWVQALAFSPDGKQFVAGRFDGSLTFYDSASFKEVRTLWTPPEMVASANE